MERKNLNVNLPLETFKRLDDYSKKYQIPRTSAVAMLINTALDGQEMVQSVGKLTELLEELRETESTSGSGVGGSV